MLVQMLLMNYANLILLEDYLRSKYERDHICGSCMKGKQLSVIFKPTNEVSTSRSSTLLHLDLFRPNENPNPRWKILCSCHCRLLSRFTC